jgi:error-prone DNA polymerase
MAARFEDHPDAVAETLRLADRLRFDLTHDLGYRYPGSEDEEADRKLAELCWARFDDRYPHGHPRRLEALGRLEEELRVIEVLGLAGFFILHRDLLELAREVAAEVRGADAARALLPPGRGRGSSVSSIVCYLTGLSHIDPVTNDLFLGRFLNEELTALPDIDLDFPRDVREVLIPRVHDRYGRERSALVAAFPTYRSRGAIREIGKALGLPPGEIERVARVAEPWASSVDRDIELALDAAASGEAPAVAVSGPPPVAIDRFGGQDPAMTPWQALGGGKTPDYWRGPAESASEKVLQGRWGWLARLARDAYGLPRHLSQHPGGMIVSTRPLLDCVPLVPAAMVGRQMCHWDKDSCADAGFLKIDLLGLGMLSAVERCVTEIARTRGECIDLSRIPFDDAATYDAIQAADTMGVFQIESRAQMQSLMRTRPESLEDLTIQVAIVRPGPIVGGAVNPYIQRRQALRADPSFKVPYPHPSLEPVLKETLGTIIFQDQVLEVAMAFAGFSPGEAEGLRRAMSRKRSAAAIEAYHERFLEGAARTHGASREVAEEIFTMIAGFSGFGFPKAHGAAFGLLAYQSTWLRVHYKPEFLCALLNEQPMGFYPSDTLVHEAQRTGIDVLAPDVNASQLTCVVEALPRKELGPPARPPRPRVRIGLGYLVGARADEMAAIVAEREAHGPFADLADLASRAGAGRPSLEVLAWSGACDHLIGASSAHARRTALWRLGIAAPAHRAPAGSQLALPLELPAAPALRPLEAWEAMVADYATTGMTVGAHPVALLRQELPAGAVTSNDLRTLPHGRGVVVAGLVVARQRPGTANGIVFMLLEDELGTMNLIVPPEVYERDRLVVRGEPLVVAEGRLEKHAAGAGAINVVVRSIRPVEAAPKVGAAERRAPAPEREVPVPVGAGRGGPDGSEPAFAAAVAGRGAEGVRDFGTVAPAVQNFGSGRRR